MRILSILLLSLSLTAFAAGKTPKKKAREPKPSDKVELVLSPGDVTDVRVLENKQKNVVDEMVGGKISPGGSKIYQTNNEFVSFYAVGMDLAGAAAKQLEKLTSDNPKKKLVVKNGKKEIFEAWIKAPINDGKLQFEPARPKYDPKSDGSKESAQSKATAEKAAADIRKKLVKGS